MTVKQLNERLRLMEPDEKMTITAGEIRALLNYTVAKTVEGLGRKAEEKVMEYKAVGLTGQEVPNMLGLHSVLDFIRNHPHYGASEAYGNWDCIVDIMD